MSSENSADSTTRNSEALIKANRHKDKEAFISLGKEESQNADVNCWRGLMPFFLILTIKCGRVHPQTCSHGLTESN